MDCRAIEPLLSAWMDGQLGEERARQVRDHLAGCPSCWAELQAVEQVGGTLTTLKSAAVGTTPEGLLAGVRALPAWMVWVALLRRWVLLGGGVATTCVAAWLVFTWSDPMSATLTARGTSDTQFLTTGRMLTAADGETVDLTLSHGGGRIQLQGPGALVIRRAAMGHLGNDQRLALELPGGSAAIRFGADAPAHDIRLTTPHARIRLTGTWVVVSADPAVTQVDVLEGSAVVTHLADGARVQVSAGDRVQVQVNGLRVMPIPVEEWLARKGLVLSADQMLPPAPSETDGSLGTSTLWHEAE